jgi:hypothetical protein
MVEDEGRSQRARYMAFSIRNRSVRDERRAAFFSLESQVPAYLFVLTIFDWIPFETLICFGLKIVHQGLCHRASANDPRDRLADTRRYKGKGRGEGGGETNLEGSLEVIHISASELFDGLFLRGFTLQESDILCVGIGASRWMDAFSRLTEDDSRLELDKRSTDSQPCLGAFHETKMSNSMTAPIP